MRLFRLLFATAAAFLFFFSLHAQTVPESVVLYRSGALDTVRVSRAPVERARSYFEAVTFYTSESRWDSAHRALMKATRLVPIDTLLRNDVNGKLTMAQLELQRRSNASAVRWATAAFSDAQYKWTNDSLALLSQQLQTIYSAAGQNDMAWRFRRFSDSLSFENERAQAADSLARVRFEQRETQQRLRSLEQQLKASNDEKERWFYYALVPLAAATLFLLLAVVVLMVRSARRKPGENQPLVADTKAVVQRGAVHTVAGYTDLMLQRGRTGEDLLTLKAMGRELRRLRQVVVATETPAPELDDDRVMRLLKGIGLLICSDNSDAALLLKSWLRKRIRLCDIHELTAIEDLPNGFSPDAILADIDNVTDGNVQSLSQLRQKFPSVAFIVISANIDSFDALKPVAVLRKPFDQNLLLAELIERYSPKSEQPVAAVERPAPYETETREKLPVALDLAIQHHCEKLERAFPADDHNALVESCRALDPLLHRAGVNATKWLEVIAEKPVGVTNLQTQLAFKNVVTYCRQAVARLQPPEQP